VAQAKSKIPVGYLHTLAVDEQIWLSDHLGSWRVTASIPIQGVQDGLELFKAMSENSIDMLATGAVISNFPARGQGKMFLPTRSIRTASFGSARTWG